MSSNSRHSQKIALKGIKFNVDLYSTTFSISLTTAMINDFDSLSDVPQGTLIHYYFIKFLSPIHLTDALGNLKAICPAKSELYWAEKLQCSNGDLQQPVISILHEQGLLQLSCHHLVSIMLNSLMVMNKYITTEKKSFQCSNGWS